MFVLKVEFCEKWKKVNTKNPLIGGVGVGIKKHIYFFQIPTDIIDSLQVS